MNFIERSINSSRLFLHLSISEGFGIVLLEAVAAEVPRNS
jgi:glycosyltransferase involved in cell wall biosynthesis